MEMTRVLLGALGVDESEYDDHIEFVEDRKFNDKVSRKGGRCDAIYRCQEGGAG